MDIKDISELARILSGNGLTRLELSEGGTRVVLEKEALAQLRPVETAAAAVGGQTEVLQGGAVDFNDLTEVKSPMVGVFYSAPSPGSPPFVSIGSAVKKGDILCIIEAMKLLNEITAEQDGEIVDICVKNGDIAEFGQVLFKMV